MVVLSVFSVTAFAEEDGDCHHAMVVERKCGIVPYCFSEKYIVVKLRELRGELAEYVAPGCLCDFILSHD